MKLQPTGWPREFVGRKIHRECDRVNPPVESAFRFASCERDAAPNPYYARKRAEAEAARLAYELANPDTQPYRVPAPAANAVESTRDD